MILNNDSKYIEELNTILDHGWLGICNHINKEFKTDKILDHLYFIFIKYYFTDIFEESWYMCNFEEISHKKELFHKLLNLILAVIDDNKISSQKYTKIDLIKNLNDYKSTIFSSTDNKKIIEDYLRLGIRFPAYFNFKSCSSDPLYGKLGVELLDLYIKAGGKIDDSIIKHACITDNLEIIKYILKFGEGYHKCIGRYLSQSNKFQVFKFLLSYEGYNVNLLFDLDHMKNLIYNSQTYLLKELFYRGIDVNTAFYNTTLLCLSIKNKNKLMMEFLIENGAYVNENRNINSPIIDAIYYEDIDIVKLLIDHGADVNKKNYDGNTPLFCAIKLNNIDILKVLLEECTDPNEKDSIGYSLLFYAVKQENLNAIDLLLKYGADINIRNSNGESILIFAVKVCKLEVLENIISRLLEYNADVNINNNENKNLFEVIIEGYEIVNKYQKRGIFFRVIDKLLDYSLDININKLCDILFKYNECSQIKRSIVTKIIQYKSYIKIRNDFIKALKQKAVDIANFDLLNDIDIFEINDIKEIIKNVINNERIDDIQKSTFVGQIVKSGFLSYNEIYELVNNELKIQTNNEMILEEIEKSNKSAIITALYNDWKRASNDSKKILLQFRKINNYKVFENGRFTYKDAYSSSEITYLNNVIRQNYLCTTKVEEGLKNHWLNVINKIKSNKGYLLIIVGETLIKDEQLVELACNIKNVYNVENTNNYEEYISSEEQESIISDIKNFIRSDINNFDEFEKLKTRFSKSYNLAFAIIDF